MDNEKLPVYFLMPDEKPNGESFMKLHHELFMKGFDDSFLQPTVILTDKQHAFFISWLAGYFPIHIPSGAPQLWQYAGFQIRILRGTIE